MLQRNLLLLFVLLLGFSIVRAQELIGVTTAPSYNENAFYRLSDDKTVNIENADWELAFTVVGQQDAGIHVNEGSRTSFGNPQAKVQVYLANTNDWNATIDMDSLTGPLGNDEQSWLYGALNTFRDPSDPFDYGWGSYDFMSHQVSGTNNLFVVKLRDGTYKKLQIESLVISTYNFRYANLDGSDEVTVGLDKNDYPDQSIVFYSLANQSVVSEVDFNFDLMFCRYVTPVEDNTGTFIPFDVTGTLSGYGVAVAEARGVDPFTVEYADYEDSLSFVLDVIGYDWKVFDNGWSIPEDLVYFVSTPAEQVWMIRFLTFSGSGSGEIIFEKTDVTPTSSARDVADAFGALVYPNPASGEVNLVFEGGQVAGDLEISLHDMQGRVVRQYRASTSPGLNALRLNDLPTTTGLYMLRLWDGQRQQALRLNIR